MIKIEQLVKRFGKFTAVDHIGFEIPPGEIFGFLGANGAGKTTTIRMMCGLLAPTEGDIYINNISVKKNPERIKRSIGYMSQKFSLYKDLSPDRNIDFFGAVYGVPKEVLKKHKEHFARTIGTESLSGIITADLPMGFKQRLGLTCALLHDPAVVFLDEPTSGVDPAGRRNFWKSIYDLSLKGKTILVTTHFMDEAEYCDRIAIMSFGRVIEIAPPEEIKEKYTSDNLNDAFIKAIEQDRRRREA